MIGCIVNQSIVTLFIFDNHRFLAISGGALAFTKATYSALATSFDFPF